MDRKKIEEQIKSVIRFIESQRSGYNTSRSTTPADSALAIKILEEVIEEINK